MAKYKNNCLKECRALGWFYFINYIFGRYSIISTWCAHHDVHYVLQFGTSFEPKWPKTSFLASNSKVKVFFIIWWFDWIKLMILVKMHRCVGKLEQGLYTYYQIHLLGPYDPNVVSRPQNPRSGNFWDFIILLICYNSEENEALFVKIGARILDLWLDTSFGS